MLEMRREAEHRELIRPGRPPAAEIAAGMSGYITQYQLDAVRFPLTLHSGDLPASVEAGRAGLDTCVGEILAALPTKPIAHRNHAQWVYHRYHFERTRRARAAPNELLAQIAALERETTVAPARASAERLQALRAALRDLDRRHQREKALDHVFAGFLAREMAPSSAGPACSPRLSAFGKIYHRLLGALPDVPAWSPYYLAQRPFLDGLQQLQAERPSAVLAICRGESIVRRVLAGLDGEHMVLSAATVATIGIEDYAERFDLCIIELGQEEFLYLPLILGILERVMASLRPRGIVRLYWANNSVASPEVSQSIFTETALRALTPDVSLTFFGSHLAAAAMQIVNWALVWPGSPLRRRIALGGALATGALLALGAYVCGCRSASSLSAFASPCIAATATLRKQAATVGRS